MIVNAPRSLGQALAPNLPTQRLPGRPENRGETYHPAKRCVVVGRLVRKTGGNRFILGTRVAGRYEEHEAHAHGDAIDALEMIEGGRTIQIAGSAHDGLRGSTLWAREICIVSDDAPHVEPPTF